MYYLSVCSDQITILLKLSQAMMELVEAGVIDNSMKTVNRGVCIGAQAAGSKKFYRYLDHHAMFATMPVKMVIRYWN